MRAGTPAILLATPAAAGLGNRGARGCGEGACGGGPAGGGPAAPRRAAALPGGGRHVGAVPAPAVRVAAFQGRACPRQRPRPRAAPPHRRPALVPGGGPPDALSATPVPAVQRSD